jgi:hypothetical protein
MCCSVRFALAVGDGCSDVACLPRSWLHDAPLQVVESQDQAHIHVFTFQLLLCAVPTELCMHLLVPCRDVRALFTDWNAGFYEHTKLANLYTAFEMQRR